MSVIDELRSVIARIEAEHQHDAAIKIMSDFLRRRLVQRHAEVEQGRRVYSAFRRHDAVAVREFEEFTQYADVKQRAAEFLQRLASNCFETDGVLREESHAQA
jgi:hypothetical protein